MPSERIQHQIDRLLDEAEEAVSRSDWALARDRAQNVLAFDPENSDALAFLFVAERALDTSFGPTSDPTIAAAPAYHPSEPLPAFFKDGRYRVELGIHLDFYGVTVNDTDHLSGYAVR